jgi:hypothetical protein
VDAHGLIHQNKNTRLVWYANGTSNLVWFSDQDQKTGQKSPDFFSVQQSETWAWSYRQKYPEKFSEFLSDF